MKKQEVLVRGGVLHVKIELTGCLELQRGQVKKNKNIVKMIREQGCIMDTRNISKKN